MSGRKWTPEEFDLLQELWGHRTMPQIAKALNRTPEAVKIKISRLQLGTYESNSEFMNARQVSYMLGIDVHTVTDYWIPKLGLKCTKRAPTGSRKFTYIKVTDLMRWLQDHQDKWDSRKLELYALGSEPEWLTAKRSGEFGKPILGCHKWTQREDDRLRMLFRKGLTDKQIAAELGRSEAGVGHRRQRIDMWETRRATA